MAANRKNIEYEMSKFEEEITKLTPASDPYLATTAVHKPKINIQIPSSFSNMPTMTYPQAPIYPDASSIPVPSYLPPMPPVMPIAGPVFPTVSYEVPKPKPAQPKPSKVATTTAAAAAAAVAATTAEMEKISKAKEAKDKKRKKFIRAAAGQTWEDESLADWDPDDFRLFCGDLGNEVNDEALARAFQKYPSFQKAKVIRDRRSQKSKGYGFVSFKSSEDFIKAMREMNGKYVGNRPIKLRKSTWKDRNLDIVKKKETEKQKMGFR